MGRFSTIIETLESRTLLAGSPLGASEAAYAGGTQLRLQGSADADAITVTRTVDGSLLVANGDWSQLFGGSYKSLRIDAGAGDDAVTLDASVDLDAILYGGAGNDALTGGGGDDRLYGGLGANTLAGGGGDDVLVSIGGANTDRLTGDAGRDSFWADAVNKKELITDASPEEWATGSVHRVGSYVAGTNKPEGGVKRVKASVAASKGAKAAKAPKAPKAPKPAKAPPANPMDLLGQDLADPAVTPDLVPAVTYQRFDDRPLFAEQGPSPDDVAQGFAGDCYFLAVLSSVARVDPTEIRETVVDLGDGTYCVQFAQGGKSVFLRVDNELPKLNEFTQLAYAGLGGQDSMWVAVVEKAYAFFRTGAGTYQSIEAGWMGEADSALGLSSSSTYSASSASSLLSLINKDLNAGKSVTFAVDTPAEGSGFVAYHAYSVDGVVANAKGVPTHLRLRNPWGNMDGDTTTDGVHDGYLTVTAQQALASMIGFASAVV